MLLEGAEAATSKEHNLVGMSFCIVFPAFLHAILLLASVDDATV